MHYVVNKNTIWDLNGVYICEQLSILDNGNFSLNGGNFSLSKWEFPVALDGATRRWKSLIVKLNVSIHQRDKQTDTARQQRPLYGLRRSQGNHLCISHYVVLIVCFCYALLINDCLVWSIVENTKKLTQEKRARWQNQLLHSFMHLLLAASIIAV